MGFSSVSISYNNRNEIVHYIKYGNKEIKHRTKSKKKVNKT